MAGSSSAWMGKGLGVRTMRHVTTVSRRRVSDDAGSSRLVGGRRRRRRRRRRRGLARETSIRLTRALRGATMSEPCGEARGAPARERRDHQGVRERDEMRCVESSRDETLDASSPDPRPASAGWFVLFLLLITGGAASIRRGLAVRRRRRGGRSRCLLLLTQNFRLPTHAERSNPPSSSPSLDAPAGS